MIDIPDSLVERFRTRQTALVTGLGCGELAGEPGWPALIEWLAGRLPNADDRAAALKLVASGRLADATALIRDAIDPALLPAAIREAYPGGVPIPDAIEQAAGLPWRAVVTTGFDDLWERALTSQGDDRHPVRVLVGKDGNGTGKNGDPGELLLMHLFGDAAVPDSLCFGPGDAHARLTPSNGFARLQNLRRTRSLVLIGFRATDPDLAWLMSWMAVVPGGDVPHFLFLDVSRELDPSGEARLVALRTGMNVIPCPGGTAEAVEILAELSAKIGAEVAPRDADVDIFAWLARWAVDPVDPEPREVLERAAAALRAEQKWERLTELLFARFELQDDRDDQVAALREAAAILRDSLHSPERALKAGLAALRLVPLDDDLWEGLRADAEASGGWEELLAEGTEVAEALGQTPEAARIWREIARVAWHQLGRLDGAVAAYEQSRAADPDHDETLDELRGLLRELERWEELAGMLRAAAARTKDPAQASDLWWEAAEVFEDRLGDVSLAIFAYEEVLAADPESARGIAALERLYEGQERWADLATLLARRAAIAGPERAATLRRRGAAIAAEQLGLQDAATTDLEAMVAANPKDRETLRLLERIYEKAERHEARLSTVQRLADIAIDDAERLTLLRRLAIEWEPRPGGLDRAADALEDILQIDPRDPDAFPALLRVYRAAGRPIALVDLLTMRIQVADTDEARAALQFALGETYDEGLDDPAKAFDAYAAAEQLGDRREDTYVALVRLAERLNRWEACAGALLRWAEVAPDASMRAEVLLQAGFLYVDQLQDWAAADAQLTKVLEIMPGHRDALVALARVCGNRGDFARATGLLLRASESAPDASEKARLLTEAAMIHQDQLGEEDRAVDLYAIVLSIEPAHVQAGERLADILFERGKFAEVESILDMLAREQDPTDRDRALTLQTRLATVWVELGKPDKAAQAFAAAYQIGPESLAVLRGYADFRMHGGEWKEAGDLYASLVRLHGESLSASDLLDVTRRLGQCCTETAQTVEAIGWYEKAYVLDPKHRPTILALATLHEAKGDWAAWVRNKRSLMAIAGPEELAPLLEQIGDVSSERLGNFVHAVTAYEAALKLEPERRSTLHKILELYTKGNRWQSAAETLVRLADVEGDKAVRARALYTAALIRRDELGHLTEAADLFERALDDAPEMTQAFDALEKLYRDESDWKELARSYRRMIKRLPVDGMPDLRLRLWTRLGEVSLKRLRNREAAQTAFEVAVSLDPTDVGRREVLADLYVQAGPDAREKAIASYQYLVERDPNRMAPYRALAKLYGETGELDKQWCVAATLSFLHKADADLEAIYQRYRTAQLPLAQRRFSEEVWHRVLHPEEDRLLDALFVLVGAPLAGPAARPHAACGLRRRRRVDINLDTRPAARAFFRVVETMDLAKPDLFFAQTQDTETALLNLQDKGVLTPALVLGRSTLGRETEAELVFDLAKRMAFMRPERFLRHALWTRAALDQALRVALTLSRSPEDGDAAEGPDSNATNQEVADPEVDRLVASLLRTMAPPILDELGGVGRRLLDERGEHIDLTRWIVATDLTAARAAFVVAGDLWSAARVISSEPVSVTPLAAKERLKDLIGFSVSEDYFACRRLLGLEVG